VPALLRARRGYVALVYDDIDVDEHDDDDERDKN
jgi:hypothetical protein